MNSWERVVRAMELGVPDRVPLYEMAPSPRIVAGVLGVSEGEVLVNNPRIFYDLLASGRKLDLEKFNERLVDQIMLFHEKLGLDWIRVYGTYTPVCASFELPKEVKKIDDDTWLIDGKRQRWTGESMWNLDEPETYDPDELLKTYREAEVEPPNPMIYTSLRAIVKRSKGKFFVSFDADGTWGPIVSNPNLLRHVLIWVYTRPDVVEAIIDYNTRIAIEWGKGAIDEGADAIQLCVDYGTKNGPWLSPEMFRKFVKPALKRHVDAFRKKGAFVVLHSDGYIMQILEDVVDAGVNAYQGIDVVAGMDLREVKERFGDKICLVGNVDPRIIEYGTKEDVAREVDRCLRDGARGGGYILSTSANVSTETNVENFVFMLEYAKKRGVYHQPR